MGMPDFMNKINDVTAGLKDKVAKDKQIPDLPPEDEDGVMSPNKGFKGLKSKSMTARTGLRIVHAFTFLIMVVVVAAVVYAAYYFSSGVLDYGAIKDMATGEGQTTAQTTTAESTPQQQ